MARPSAALRELELARALESAPVATVVADASTGHVLFANARGRQALRSGTAELRGLPWADLHPPEVIAADRSTLEDLWAGSLLGPTTVTVRCRDGSHRAHPMRSARATLGRHEVALVYLDDPDANAAGTLTGAAPDPSVPPVLDDLGVGVAIIDPEMRVQSVNRRTRTWYPGVDFGGRPKCFKVFNDPPREAPCSWCAVVPLFRDGQVHETITSTPGPGGVRHFRIVASPVRDASGAIVAAMELVEDVTEKHRALELQRQMQASQAHRQRLEAIGTLAGGVAHEINNPLSVILNHAQLIEDDVPQESPAAEGARDIVRECERIAAIVRRLLSFARRDGDAQRPVSIGAILQASLALVERSLARSGVRVVVDVPEGLPQVSCNESQIQQVLVNLLTNARDALDVRYPGPHEAKVVTVRASVHHEQGEWVRLTVEDHATGIPEDVQHRIFEPFYTTKRNGAGVGLGLSVSHGIVEAHHGRLGVESEGGAFTRFHVDLPPCTDPKRSAPYKGAGI